MAKFIKHQILFNRLCFGLSHVYISRFLLILIQAEGTHVY